MSADAERRARLQRLFQAYTPVAILGRGQYGAAVLLRSPATGDMVVSKQISIEGMEDAEILKVENERRILEMLQHEHVISYFCSWYEAGLNGGAGTLHLVMEYAEGGTLADHISAQAAAQEAFPSTLVCRWISQLASALEHAASSPWREMVMNKSKVWRAAAASRSSPARAAVTPRPRRSGVPT